MKVSVTTRFVDRLLLPLHPGNPDAAERPAGAIVDADPPRCVELVRAGVAVPVGISLADLEQAAIDFALAADVVPASEPIATSVEDVAPAADSVVPDNAIPVEAQPADPVPDQSDAAEPATAPEPSDGGPVDFTK